MGRVCHGPIADGGASAAVIPASPTLAPMNRIKPLLVAGAIAAAVISFIRLRLTEDQPVDPGGWKPVDPA